ncbi:MAG: type VI secretion system tube protein Hcp [Alphaproteobacteria bacterium]|nr:type VI secretion system tube protein Hcp [Alphaproteobacteria bacterium]
MLASTKDIFLKIDQIDGESKDSIHSKWIDILDFSHGAEQSIMTGSPDAAGRGIFKPFTFKHLVDSATPKLQEACMKGSHIKDAKIDFCRAIGGKQVVTYSTKLEGIKIVKAIVKLEDLGEGNFQLVETVDMLVNKEIWTQTSIGLDNVIGGNIEASFDQTKKV